MAPHPTTYRSLLQPIPPLPNLLSLTSPSSPSTPSLPPPCTHCALLLPDRRKATPNSTTIPTPYTRTLTFPSFPELKEGQSRQCPLCRFLRKAIRSQWGVGRQMEEWGVGVLRERDRDGTWNDESFFGVAWDGRVSVRKVRFGFVPFDTTTAAEGRGGDGEGDGDAQMGGMVTSLLMEVGPATTPEEYGDIGRILAFKVFDSIDLNAKIKERQRRIPSPQVLSDRNVAMIQDWVHDCKEHHPQCRSDDSHQKREGSSPWRPTRLLKIEVDNAGDATSVRLVETTEDDTDKYIALSHMWGDKTVAPPLRTVKANYNDMLNEIDMRDLPWNFVDAVRACCRLGIHHVWIDSLCIIQDDPDDWKHEAGLMHRVYKEAELTVVATSSTNPHTGFLTRNISTLPAVQISYHLPSTATPQPQPHTLILSSTDEAGLRTHDIDQSTWNTRGWTMQERSLSTRLLHFCHNKLYFECRGRLVSEENEPERTERFSSFHMWPRPTASMTPTTTEDLYRRWMSAVGEYSRRNLTHGGDKLLAIGSLAAEMALVVGEGYIPFAGMWAGDLARQLLWYVWRGERTRPAVYRAPSWSWAGLDGVVSFVNVTIVRESLTPRGMVGRLERGGFMVGGLGERLGGDLTGGDEVGGYLEIETLVQCVSGMRENEGNAEYSMYPFHLFLEVEGETEQVVFGHAALDLDNRDNLVLDTTEPLVYAHVNHEQFPTGLVLRRRILPVSGRAVWARVGVANIFYTSGEAIFTSLFEGDGEVEGLVLV